MRHLAAAAAEVRLYQGLDHHAGQPVSPSCQQFVLAASAPIYHASGPARNPLGPANEGADPGDTGSQMHGPQERFTCSTWGMQNILSARRTSGRQLCPQQTSGGAVPARLLGRRRAPVAARTRIYTAHIGFVYGGCAHVCLCINPNGWQQFLRVEGVRATGTASQESTQSAIESRAVFGKAWSSNIYERRGAGSGQWKTNTQTDADVLTAAEARRENKTEGDEERPVSKASYTRAELSQGSQPGGHGVASRYSRLRQQIAGFVCVARKR